MPKCVLREVLGRMQFTLHTTRRNTSGRFALGALSACTLSARLVKTGRAPSRHSSDGRVYGHTTLAMHKLSTPGAILRLLHQDFAPKWLILGIIKHYLCDLNRAYYD